MSNMSKCSGCKTIFEAFKKSNRYIYKTCDKCREYQVYKADIKNIEADIEYELQWLEETIFQCEMTVERIRALNKIAPENLPKDLYDIIFKQIVPCTFTLEDGVFKFTVVKGAMGGRWQKTIVY